MVKTPPQQKRLPPLENGDRLNRYEFERRYNAMPHLKKAELIEGVVYMAAALRFRSVEGAPELVVEIAASSAAIDLGDKKRAYRRNGIQEYIVWQVFDQKVDWFYLEAGEYIPLPVDPDGVIRSRVFPGLWLAVEDLLTGNMVQVLAILQQGLASPDHAAFVQQGSTQKAQPCARADL